jgi:hypothetical protein
VAGRRVCGWQASRESQAPYPDLTRYGWESNTAYKSTDDRVNGEVGDDSAARVVALRPLHCTGFTIPYGRAVPAVYTHSVVATSRGQQARTEFVQFNIGHGMHHCRCKNSILAGIKKQLSDFMPLVTRRSAVRSAYRIIFFLPSFLLHSLRKRIPAGEELVGSRSDDRGQLPSSSTTNFLYCMVFFSIKEIY